MTTWVCAVSQSGGSLGDIRVRIDILRAEDIRLHTVGKCLVAVRSVPTGW